MICRIKLNFAEKYLEIEENKPLTKKMNMELTYKIDKVSMAC